MDEKSVFSYFIGSEEQKENFLKGKINSFENIEEIYCPLCAKSLKSPFLHKLNEFIQIKARPQDQIQLSIDLKNVVNDLLPIESYCIEPEKIGRKRGHFSFLEQVDGTNSLDFDGLVYSCYLALVLNFSIDDSKPVLKIDQIFFKESLDWRIIDQNNPGSKLVEEEEVKKVSQEKYRLLFYRRTKNN